MVPGNVLHEERTGLEREVSRLETRLRWAGVLIASGFLLQLLTFVRIHPFSFMVFVLVGCPLVVAGMLLYLYSVVSHQG
jgi:hypothetical protein